MNSDRGPDFNAPIEEKLQTLKPIEILREKAVIMGVEIPRNLEPGPRTPKPEKFKDFIEDEFSLELLQKIAKGVALNEPTLIEGEAAIGKSHTIEYLAYLTNNEVYRMSLNGQTDTTDLIGKWVPQTEKWRTQLDKLYMHSEMCKNPEAKKLIESKQIKVSKEAKEEAIAKVREAPVYSGFEKEEAMKIAELEGIEISEGDWIWQDGEMPREIENGAWTVLDEVNTCEPQILVRLNAILEKDGELVLHENGGKIAKSKNPNKTHRLFATTNPPGGKYRGRVPLSAEWISRWNYQNIGGLPEETAVFRRQKKNGCKVELKIGKLKKKFISFFPIEEDTFAEIFGDEWTSDYCQKYVSAFYKIQEMVEKGEVAKDQLQKFDYDQRDWDRFDNYIKRFCEFGNIKKVIKDAVSYTMLGKIKSKNDRDKIENVVIGLIEVDEPKVAITIEKKQLAKIIKGTKADIISMVVPEKHLQIISEI